MRLAFKHNTNWCVITGAPSSGKTSVINALAARGFATQNEVARDIIELSIARGRKLEDIRKEALALQKNILRTALAREMGMDTKAQIFFDRGLPDSITYFRIAGLEAIEATAMSYLYKYRAVFIFDRLPVVADHVRTENDEQANNIDLMLEADYRALGYEPIRVPVMSVEARADFIIDHLQAAA